ncbi:hypothetical protein HY214_01535 [Candidatus Roizmanbacteria bacterium]|nr:hypothetical protein [Candidatus Roizmanbacteria bacterium]
MKKISFSLIVIILLIFVRNLNPLDRQMFPFHDETQSARISEFVYNLVTFNIPPRIAPHFSFKLGYPVFNFYAPFSYWLTSFITLTGMTVVSSLKLSFLLSIVGSFIFAYIFFKLYFEEGAAQLGSLLYSSSLFLAVEIFVRGNLGEAWFAALFPLALYVLKKNSEAKNNIIFLLCTLVLTGILTTHNLLSLIFVPIALFYLFLLPGKKRNMASLVLAAALGAYFFLPFIAEMHFTYAKEIASYTDYHDHFLCPLQLWQSSWGYGGSAKGCTEDGMSFMIGKIQLIFLLLGFGAAAVSFLQQKEKIYYSLVGFFGTITLVSLFLTTHFSASIWDKLKPATAVIQFPWRFIPIATLGIAFFGAYTWHNFCLPYKKGLLLVIITFLTFKNAPYFYHPPVSETEFLKTYNTNDYIETKVAYRIAEYLPKTANYQAWRQFDTVKKIPFNYRLPVESSPGSYRVIQNEAFKKTVRFNSPAAAFINIHYLPYWHILLDGREIFPQRLDMLGRPMLTITSPATLSLYYQQTPIEQLGNWISLSTLIFLLGLVTYRPLWNKPRT